MEGYGVKIQLRKPDRESMVKKKLNEINPLMPNRYNCIYVLFLVLKSSCQKNQPIKPQSTLGRALRQITFSVHIEPLKVNYKL